MYAAIKNSKVNDKFQDPLYLFLELVRAGVMHGHLWSGRAFSGGPSFGTDEEKACMLLVMRVLSIVPLNFKVSAILSNVVDTNFAFPPGAAVVCPALTRAACIQLFRAQPYARAAYAARGHVAEYAPTKRCPARAR